jgi:hypothetical protein
MVSVVTIKIALIVYNIVVGFLFWTYRYQSLKHFKRSIDCFVAIKVLNAFELLTSLFDGMSRLGDISHIGIIFLFSYAVQIWVDSKSPRKHEYGTLFAYSIAAVYAYRFIEPIAFYSTIATSVLSLIWIILTLTSFVIEGQKQDETSGTTNDDSNGVNSDDVDNVTQRPSLSEVFFVSIYTVLFLILGSIDNVTYVKANDAKPIDLFSLGLDTIGYTVIPLFIIEFANRAAIGASLSSLFELYDIDNKQLDRIGAEDISVSEVKRKTEMTNLERLIFGR